MMEPGDERAAAARGRGHLRASHADRERVIEVLKDAFVQGRLTSDELDARVGQAFASRTYVELDALTADIPAELASVRPSKPIKARPAPPGNATVKTGARVITAATVLTAGVWTGAFFSPAVSTASGMLIWAFTFTWLGIVILVGAVMLESSRQNRSGGQLPPRPGPHRRGLQGRPGPVGDPAARTDRTRADLRTNRPERDRRHPTGPSPRAPCGTWPVPGAA
jgi:Domain of unknown function (DUF1707)